jgi:hypothetical protein
MVQRLRDTMGRSLGALLVARRGQTSGNRCVELGAILEGWDGTFTILMRKRIARHIETCATCEQDRRRMVNPVALLGGAPVFIPAPAWLRDHTLSQIQLTSAGTNMSNANPNASTQARPSLPGAPSERLSIAAVDGHEAGADEDGAVDAQPVGRVMLIMSLLIGIPLIALGLTIAWQHESNAPVSPIGVTGTVPPPSRSAPAGPATTNNPAPQPPGPTTVATTPRPTTPRPAPPLAPTQQPPPSQPPAPPTAYEPPPPPPRHRPPITEEPPPSSEPPQPPVPTDQPTPSSGIPLPPGRRPPVTVGPVTPAPVTTTGPVIG